MFLKNKNIFFEMRRSKVTDYAALINGIIYFCQSCRRPFLSVKGHESTRPLLISGILYVYTCVLTLFLPVKNDDSICPNSGDTFASYNQR